jgi:SPP1 family predicted phage head-tail adaptor
MRDLVTIQTRAGTPDGQGGLTEAWTTVDQVRANVRGHSGTETFVVGQQTYSVNFTISMRWRSDLTPAKRLLWLDGAVTRTLDIVSVVNPDGLHVEALITAVEHTPAAP